jgi:hypothetical protein
MDRIGVCMCVCVYVCVLKMEGRIGETRFV